MFICKDEHRAPDKASISSRQRRSGRETITSTTATLAHRNSHLHHLLLRHETSLQCRRCTCVFVSDVAVALPAEQIHDDQYNRFQAPSPTSKTEVAVVVITISVVYQA